MSNKSPSVEAESEALRHFSCVGGIDEVGRGSLAGPLAVGVAVLRQVGCFPSKLRDSKLLSPQVRLGLIPQIKDWVDDSAIGYASAAEIDGLGVTASLRLAAWRALEVLEQRGNCPQWVLLDGPLDYVSDPGELALFFDREQNLISFPRVTLPQVCAQPKADMTSALVGAASVLAKVDRDTLMEQTPDPGYSWAQNKGYGTQAHLEALRRLGRSHFHRLSFTSRAC